MQTFDLGEGPRWFHERWYFVDILTGRLLTVDVAEGGAVTARTVLRLDGPLGAVAAIRNDKPGAWLAALDDGIAIVTAGDVTWLDRPERGGSVRTRMNDGACDPHGRFWAGSMGYDAEHGAGSLYRTDTDGTVTRVLDGLTIPNGPVFSADGAVMYLTDSARGTISRYPLDPESGDLGPGEPYVDVADAVPDGMALDDEGALWVAMWGTGRIDRFAATGELLGSMRVASRQPTAPAFGGRTGKQMLVTSARIGLRDTVAGDGAAWLCDVEVGGPLSATAII